jgi:hypothetical protein
VATSRQKPGTPAIADLIRPNLLRSDLLRPDLFHADEDAPPAPVRLPSVRLASHDELAAMALVAPLLRAARDLALWVGQRPGESRPAASQLAAATAEAAALALDLAPREVRAAWRVVVATARLAGPGKNRPDLAAVLAHGDAELVLRVWDAALASTLESDELDGIATALYTVGGPVGMDGLFEAYAAAAGSRMTRPARIGADEGAALSLALETLADLAVVELGTDDADGSLTVALSPLGTWGIQRRLRAQGWHVPVAGRTGKDGARALLAALAACDAENGEAEITAWLNAREPAAAAAELIDAAASGSPGQRGAAFAVLDRIGLAGRHVVRDALAEPLLRAHAAVWLIEHGEDAQLDPADRTWLLVDLGAGLLEEASAQDVVGELLPSLPPEDQAEIVARLWKVSHPGVTDFLTALSDHHPVPAVARAARKAAFKARSPAAHRLTVTE